MLCFLHKSYVFLREKVFGVLHEMQHLFRLILHVQLDLHIVVVLGDRLVLLEEPIEVLQQKRRLLLQLRNHPHHGDDFHVFRQQSDGLLRVHLHQRDGQIPLRHRGKQPMADYQVEHVGVLELHVDGQGLVKLPNESVERAQGLEECLLVRVADQNVDDGVDDRLDAV